MHMLTFLLLLFGLAAQPEAAILVNTPAMTIADDGACSLPEAILAAETDMPSGASDGECAAGNGADVIWLDGSAEYVLTEAYETTNSGAVGLPPVYTQVTIEGNGATIRRDATADAFRLFEVRGDEAATPEEQARLVLAGLTLADGDAREGLLDIMLDYDPDPFQTGRGGAIVTGYGTVVLDGVTLTGNTAEVTGGAVYNNRGLVEVRNSTFTDNTATNGGALGAQHGRLLVDSTRFSDNTASFGGAVHLFDMAATFEAVTVTDNTGSRFGGGIYSESSTLDLTASSLLANTADYGGGLYLAGADSVGTALDTTFADNIATEAGTLGGGGAIQAFGSLTLVQSVIERNEAVNGGGVYGFLADLTLTETQVTANTATESGGGVYLRGGSLAGADGVQGNTAPDDVQIAEG